MSEDQLVILLDLLREFRFYFRVLCIAASFLTGLILVKLIIHSKNQRDLI